MITSLDKKAEMWKMPTDVAPPFESPCKLS